jgi:hypothetical protein
VIKEADSAGGSFKRLTVYRELAASHAGLLFDGYQKAANGNELDRVFLPREGVPFDTNQLREFSAAYTATMRDMRSAGVASLHTGIPLWLLPDRSALINRRFNGRDITRRLLFLMNVSAMVSASRAWLFSFCLICCVHSTTLLLFWTAER